MSEEMGQFIMRALTKTILFTAALLLTFHCSLLTVDAQSRTTRIYRPCGNQPLSVSPRTPAQVTLDVGGTVTISPCYQQAIRFTDPHNGPTTGLQWSSLAGFTVTGDMAQTGQFSITGDLVFLTTSRLALSRTITAGGTTGAQTINKMAGTVNFAAAATSIVVTNSTVTATSIVFPVIRTADTTCTFVKSVVPAAGSFTITLNAGCAAETSIGFFVTN